MSKEYKDLRRPIAVGDIGPEGAALYHIFGADSTKRANLSLIEDNVLVYVCGNAVIFENLETSSKYYLLGLDDGGVGCVTIHPSRYVEILTCKHVSWRQFLTLKLLKRW